MKNFVDVAKFSACFLSCSLMLLGMNACSDDSSTPVDVPAEIPEEPGNVIDEGNSSDSHLPVQPGSSAVLEGNSSGSVPVTPGVSSSSSLPVVGAPESSSSSKKQEISDTKVKENAYGIRGGFFNSPVELAVPQNANGVTLRCSYNGSMPNQYSEPLTSARRIESNTVVRCIGFNGETPVDTLTESFFVNENVRMPVVSVSVDPQFFAQNYVYERRCAGGNPINCTPGLMADVEYPAHVEYFADGSSSQSKTWEINAGISLMGHWSRTYAKKSVSIAMRQEYQDGRLRYPLFETRPNDKKFKGFNLRNNGNRFVGNYMEDAMASSLLEGSGVDYQRSRQVVVFYNGEYYGIHDLREKMNEHFVETNYGIDSKNVDIVKHVDEEITAGGGTVDGYVQMLQYIASNDFSGTNNDKYEYIKTVMDVGNYADYMAAQIYFKNGDWPNNNVRAWRSPEQPWKFMVFDLDHGFGWDWAVTGFNYDASGAPTMFDWILQGGKMGGGFDSSPVPCSNNASAKCFHTIFAKLIKNDDFRRLFANHAAVMYSYYLNQSKVAAATTRIVQSIDNAEISRDMSKFPRDFGHDFDVSGSIFASWAGQRDGAIWGEYQDFLGLASPISVSVKSSGNGAVLVDGMKLPGSSTSTDYSGKFFGGNQMELSAVPAAGAVFVGWDDGSVENPRLVSPQNGATYTAKFQ